MKITFLATAYTAIGFNTSYTGRFIIDGNNYVENENGKLITLALPSEYSTVGRTLTSK